MIEQNVFYYPYATLGDKQLTMLKAIALYFDKLYILDPLKASWAGIGSGQYENDIRLLEHEGILQRIAPEDVMHKYEQSIAQAIRNDLNDDEFKRLCNDASNGSWTLALAKVPADIRNDPNFQPIDRSMQNILQNVGTDYNEEFSGLSPVYDEYRETYDGVIEYRYADYPFSVGEAIMLNHALVGSLLHTDAVPLTDGPVHSGLLNYKLQKAQQIPEIRDVLEQRQSQHQFAHASATIQALTDLELGVIPADLSLEKIIRYRQDNQDELAQVREKLSWLVREIKQQPWTKEFDDEIYHKLIPELRKSLLPAQESWTNWVKLSSIALGGAAVALGVFASPLTPVAVGVAGLTLTKDIGLGGFDWYKDWKSGKNQNGLHYLMKLKKI